MEANKKRKIVVVNYPGKVVDADHAINSLGGIKLLSKRLRESQPLFIKNNNVMLEKKKTNDVIFKITTYTNKKDKSVKKVEAKLIGELDSMYDCGALHDFSYRTFIDESELIDTLRDDVNLVGDSKSPYHTKLLPESFKSVDWIKRENKEDTQTEQSSTHAERLKNGVKNKNSGADESHKELYYSFYQPVTFSKGRNCYPSNYKGSFSIVPKPSIKFSVYNYIR